MSLPESRLQTVLGNLLGGALGGLLIGAAEVTWNVAQPEMWNPLRLASFIPPRDLAHFLQISLVTSGGLGAILGLAVGLVLGFLRPPRFEGTGGLIGATAACGLIGAMILAVWVNLLTEASPGSFMAISSVIGTCLVFAFLVLLFAFGIRRLFGHNRIWLAALFLTLFVGLSSLSAWFHGRIPYPSIPELGIPRAGTPNILFVTLDTVRAESLAAYGGQAESETLSDLAREGVLFQNAYSAVPHTTPSHVTMFTSLYPFEHKSMNGVPIRPGMVTLPGVLRESGYRTAAFVSAYTTKSNVTGLGDFFEIYSDSMHPWIDFIGDDGAEPLALYKILDRQGINQVAGDVVNRRALSWASTQDKRPFFLWVHYFDAHGPYEPPSEYADRYVTGQEPTTHAVDAARYTAEVDYTDDLLGELLAGLAQEQLLDNTITLITSDHGEAFGEPHPREDFGHGHAVYDQTVRIPLVVTGPGVSARLAAPDVVETRDLAPTLLELIDVPIPPSFGGRSLAPLLRGEALAEAENVAIAQTLVSQPPNWFSIRIPEWKLHLNVEDGTVELFDMSRDPGETIDVADENDDIVQALELALESRVQLDSAVQPELDAETEARLRALGYLD